MRQRWPGNNGYWASLQLDNAVIWFGRYISNKLMETDPNTHKYIYTLEGLLGDTRKRSLKDGVIEAASKYGGGLKFRRIGKSA